MAESNGENQMMKADGGSFTGGIPGRQSWEHATPEAMGLQPLVSRQCS